MRDDGTTKNSQRPPIGNAGSSLFGILFPLLNHIKAGVGNQGLRDADALRSLVILQQRSDDTGKSQGTTIQGVAELDLLVLVPITAFQAVCLIGIEV